MEYHGIPWNIGERRWNIFGTPMEYQAISWNAYRIARYIQGLITYGTLMKYKGTSWFIYWRSMEYLLHML